MADLTKGDVTLLNKLVTDCITFGLSPAESKKYIEIEYGRSYSDRAIRLRKAKLQSENASTLWLNYFTRIGFVQHHQKLIEDIRKIYDDSLKRYFTETLKAKEERDEDLILRLKEDVRRSASLLSELGLGTPIISSIKQKLREQENAERVQVRQ